MNKVQSFYLFSPSKQQWTVLPGLKSERDRHGSVAIGNSIFIIGGDYDTTIEEYNISTKTFTNVATMDPPLIDFGICAINKNEVLISGGFRCGIGNNDATNKCFYFNTKSKTFKKVAGMKTKRKGHVLVNLDGVVYSIGGERKYDDFLNTIETFDPATEQWKMLDVKLNIARRDHQAVAHKHFIYIFGGWRGPFLDTIERFNVKTGQIELLDEKLRFARSRFAVGKINSDVYMFGCLTTDVVEIFNLETEKVREFNGDIPFSDTGFAACVV